MKKAVLIVITIFSVLLLNTCALEIANVIGPDGGWVFYDKGNYKDGWRYIQCSPYDFGEIKGTSAADIQAALDLCKKNNADWHKFGWELPNEADLKKMLECFSYGLTRFSSDYHYLSVNNLYNSEQYWVCSDSAHEARRNFGNHCSECGAAAGSNAWVPGDINTPDPSNLTSSSAWAPVVLHKNFKNEANGEVEKINTFSKPIRVRAIRRF